MLLPTCAASHNRAQEFEETWEWQDFHFGAKCDQFPNNYNNHTFSKRRVHIVYIIQFDYSIVEGLSGIKTFENPRK